jgi:ligand-binding sensor domain-containing protein/signal transduction histidine kinase
MLARAVAPCPAVSSRWPLAQAQCGAAVALCLLLAPAFPSQAIVLWNDSGPTLAYETGAGGDILGGAVKRDASSSDTLYFKFHVDPLSDASTEDYFAFFELYEGDSERLGVGNALKAWAYSAFVRRDETAKNADNYIDLRSAKPEPASAAAASTYEFPRRGSERTIVFKVQYVPGGDDLVTVWLNPDLGPGASEVSQPESLTTRFSANAAFDCIRLRHGGAGGGWTFSGMMIGTVFSDFVDTSSAKTETPAQDNGLMRWPFSFDSWRGQPGMPHGSVQALAQSRDGYLWLGGDDGLARFDGVRFVLVATKSELHGSPVRTLLGDSLGRLWIGTGGGGLICLNAGQFTTFKRQDGLPNDSITALAEDQQGQIWIGTEGGLAVFQNGQFGPFNSEQPFAGKPIAMLYHDSQGTMWVGATGSGVFRLNSGKFTQLTDASVDALLREPHCLLVDHSGRLWIGAGDDFALCQENAQWRRYPIPRHSGRTSVKALAEEPDGTIWAGSISEGLFQFTEGKLKAVDAGSSLSDNHVSSLFVDREGRLWVGTDSGLSRLRHNTFFVFGQDEGLGYGPVLGLSEVTPGVIWAARSKDGLYRCEGSHFSRLTAAGLPPQDPQVNALLVTKDDGCLVACARGLLRFKDPQAVADESAAAGLPDQNVISLAEDAQGRVWAGTRQGMLWRLEKGNWAQQTNLRETRPITAIVPETNGWLWVGTAGGGLYRLSENQRAHYGHKNGLHSDSIRTLYSDGETLWIGTAGGGLSWWRDDRILTVTTREGLPDDTISQILPDTAGNLWLGGDHGIACVSTADLWQTAIGKSRRLPAQRFGRADGLSSEECTSGFFPAGLKAKSGLLWFSTSLGVVAAQPRFRTNSLPAPTVLIEEINVDGVPVPSAQRLKIPPGRHRLEVQYTGLGADSPETIQFRYRLAPLDADWVEAGVRRTAFYNYVPPGDYRFQVSACGRDGVWNESGANMTVKVLLHFWQSWWFLGPALVALSASVVGAARLVERAKLHRRLKALEQERQLERERTRIAQDLHDEMGARLCRISFLSEHARRNDGLPKDLQHEINSISETSREVLHSLDEIVWAVDPQNDSLEHVASYIAQYAQDYFHMTGIECELSMPAQLPVRRISSQMRHHLFLAAHEAFTNILKHSGATRAKVSIQCDGPSLEITASDNGSGFNPSAGNGEPSCAGHDGLRNMAQRLTDIGGRCRVESAPGQGTTVRLVVPIAPHGQTQDSRHGGE